MIFLFFMYLRQKYPVLDSNNYILVLNNKYITTCIYLFVGNLVKELYNEVQYYSYLMTIIIEINIFYQKNISYD